MGRTTNRGGLYFLAVDVLENQQFMYSVIISVLIFVVSWATFALDSTTLANAQTSSKSNIAPIIGENSSNSSNLVINYGIASGDVTNHSAIIWSKSNKYSVMNVLYDT